MANCIVGCSFSVYCRSQTQISGPVYNPLTLNYKDQSYSRSNNPGRLRSSNTVKRNFVVYASDGPPDSNVPSQAPLSTKPSSDSLFDQIIRLMTVIVPFLSGKLGPLWIFKEKISSDVEKVEIMVNAVEKMAEQVDKVAEDITDDLPEGKLKYILDAVEDMAEKTAKTADNIGDLIDKVQEAEDKLDSFVDSLDDETETSPKKATA